DGIRVFHVTGVQTCALPICLVGSGEPHPVHGLRQEPPAVLLFGGAGLDHRLRRDAGRRRTHERVAVGIYRLLLGIDDDLRIPAVQKAHAHTAVPGVCPPSWSSASSSHSTDWTYAIKAASGPDSKDQFGFSFQPPRRLILGDNTMTPCE